MTPALSISHLRKVYRSGTVAVDDLSLTIAPGDFFGFLGPNGAGKSTTIHCVTGIAKPTSGTIEIFGVDAVKNYREARRLVGLSPQEFNVDPFATATPDRGLDGRLFRHARGPAQARASTMLMERFDLIAQQKKPFRELSGGLKRRVMLARALVHDPRLIILDEPTAGVDVELRRELWRYLQELNRDGNARSCSPRIIWRRWSGCAATIAIVAKGRIVARARRRNSSRAGGWKPPISPPPGAEPEHVRRASRHD